MMNFDFNLGGRRAKTVPFDGDDRMTAAAGAGLTRPMRHTTPIALRRRKVRLEIVQREAARAAAFTASPAGRRRLAAFAKEISQ